MASDLNKEKNLSTQKKKQLKTYNPANHHRRSIRLKGYNYVQSGLYSIPICCHNRACVFGRIENGIMIMNDAGKMVENEWLTLPH